MMYAVEIVEGKDHPPQKKKFANVAKNRSTTALLVLRLYEPIFHIGIVVILDSDSCVLRTIIELKKREVFHNEKKHRFYCRFTFHKRFYIRTTTNRHFQLKLLK